MRKSLLVFLSLVLLFGCGGGGGGSDPIASRYRSLMSNVNSENLNSTMSNYSGSYLHECFSWQDAYDVWSAIFATPNYSIQLTDLTVAVSIWDTDIGEGYLFGTIHVRENDNGTIIESNVDVEMWFVRVNGKWVLYGNQLCVATNTPQSKSDWRELLGVMQD